MSKHDEVVADIDAMAEAVAAISRIPTAARRALAFNWLTERVWSDIRALEATEHAEKVAALAQAVDDRLTEIVGDEA